MLTVRTSILITDISATGASVTRCFTTFFNFDFWESHFIANPHPHFIFCRASHVTTLWLAVTESGIDAPPTIAWSRSPSGQSFASDHLCWCFHTLVAMPKAKDKMPNRRGQSRRDAPKPSMIPQLKSIPSPQSPTHEPLSQGGHSNNMNSDSSNDYTATLEARAKALESLITDRQRPDPQHVTGDTIIQPPPMDTDDLPAVRHRHSRSREWRRKHNAALVPSAAAGTHRHPVHLPRHHPHLTVSRPHPARTLIGCSQLREMPNDLFWPPRRSQCLNLTPPKNSSGKIHRSCQTASRLVWFRIIVTFLTKLLRAENRIYN